MVSQSSRWFVVPWWWKRSSRLAGVGFARLSLKQRKFWPTATGGTHVFFFVLTTTNAKTDVLRFAGARVVAYGQLRRALGSWRRRRVSH